MAACRECSGRRALLADPGFAVASTSQLHYCPCAIVGATISCSIEPVTDFVSQKKVVVIIATKWESLSRLR